MSTSKVNPISKVEVPTTNHRDVQQRICSSKRTTTNFDPSVDTTVFRTHHLSKSMKQKDTIISSSKPESGSEEIYTTPLNTTRQGIDVDEESIVMNKNKTPTKHIHRLSTSVNNSAIHLQQQGMGDHYHKQHKNRSKTTTALNRKYHRHDLEIPLNERNVYRWRIFMCILTILVLTFVIYRFLLAIWPKPKKTFMEQLIDDLSSFFTS